LITLHPDSACGCVCDWDNEVIELDISQVFSHTQAGGMRVLQLVLSWIEHVV
jgi:hypothetical protein